MTFEEFNSLIKELGADLTAWPREKREAAEVLVRADARAQALITVENRIDANLELPEGGVVSDPDRFIDSVMDRITDE